MTKRGVRAVENSPKDQLSSVSEQPLGKLCQARKRPPHATDHEVIIPLELRNGQSRRITTPELSLVDQVRDKIYQTGSAREAYGKFLAMNAESKGSSHLSAEALRAGLSAVNLNLTTSQAKRVLRSARSEDSGATVSYDAFCRALGDLPPSSPDSGRRDAGLQAVSPSTKSPVGPRLASRPQDSGDIITWSSPRTKVCAVRVGSACMYFLSLMLSCVLRYRERNAAQGSRPQGLQKKMLLPRGPERVTSVIAVLCLFLVIQRKIVPIVLCP